MTVYVDDMRAKQSAGGEPERRVITAHAAAVSAAVNRYFTLKSATDGTRTNLPTPGKAH